MAVFGRSRKVYSSFVKLNQRKKEKKNTPSPSFHVDKILLSNTNLITTLWDGAKSFAKENIRLIMLKPTNPS